MQKQYQLEKKPKNCTCNYDSLLSFLVNKSRENIKDYVEKIEGLKIIDITDKNFNSNCKINLHIKNKNHLKFNMHIKNKNHLKFNMHIKNKNHLKFNLHIKNKNHLKFNMLVKLFEYNFNIDNSEIFKYLLNNETDVIKNN